jgi:hypothetical protein
MVDGLYIYAWNRTMKPLVSSLSGAGRWLGREMWGQLNQNLQCKPIWNWHDESFLYKEYIQNKEVWHILK